MEIQMSRFAKKFAAAIASAATVLASLGVAAPVLAAAHPVDSFVKSADGTVWMIMHNNCRRAFTSAGAAESYGFFSWSKVMDANADDLALAVCAEGFIPPQDGGIIFSDRGADKGTGYVISNGKKFGFPTETAFYAAGYTYAQAKWADVSWMTSGGVINDGTAAHLPGTLVNNNGTVQFVDNDGLRGFPTATSFSSWGYNFGMVVAANAADKAKTQVSVLGDRLPGYLSPTGGKGSGTAKPSPSGPLEGGAGSINDADFVSSLTNEEVGEDAEDVEVAGLEIEADDGSDIQLLAVRLDFTQGTADQDFEDYADEVSLWFDGEEVGRWDGDEFTDENNYDKTVSLDSGAIIRAGETGELTLAVSGLANIDTNDIAETWTVEFESVRFEDASGAIITDSATGDINGVTRTFSFESFATSSDVELKIAEKSGSTVNVAHLIDVDATSVTNEVMLLEFTLEAEGDSDVEIREFLADFVVTGATNVDGVIRGGASPAAHLFIEGEEYGDASYAEDGDGVTVGADEEIMWDNVNYTIDAGETVDAYITVDLNDTTGTGGTDDMDEGDTILAQITATQRAALTDIDARDETGTQVPVANISGSATGEANQVYDEIFTVESDGWTTTNVTTSDTSGIDEQVTFEITLDITAVDGNIYIDDAPCIADNANGPAATDGLAWNVTNYADFDNAAATLTSCSVSTTATDTGDGFQILDGETEEFVLAVTITAFDASDFAQVTLEGIGWTGGADGVGDRLFEGSLDDDFKSASVFINNR
jgi:hypothetical protein